MGKFRSDCVLIDILKIDKQLQTVGNCAWKSNETLLQAIIFMTIYKAFMDSMEKPDQKTVFERTLTLSAYWFTLFSEHDRRYGAKQCETLLKGHIPHRVYVAITNASAQLMAQRIALERPLLLHYNAIKARSSVAANIAGSTQDSALGLVPS